MDDFYAGVLKCSSYGTEIKFLICCFLCVVLSSVVCETGFSLLKQIKMKARNTLRPLLGGCHGPAARAVSGPLIVTLSGKRRGVAAACRVPSPAPKKAASLSVETCVGSDF